MSARILVVDDIETNRRLLEARLSAEYFDVVLAASGAECLEKARDTMPDLILLDVMMPGMDGFETCRRLKADAATRHIPVVMVTALDQREDRVKGLEAGADEFLTKPVNDVALFARVRSLLRLKEVLDELRLRHEGALAESGVEDSDLEGPAIVIVAAGDDVAAERLSGKLPGGFAPRPIGDPAGVVKAARAGAELVLIDLATAKFDALRVCARIRSDAITRHTPIICVVDPDTPQDMVRALDLGVSDVVTRPVDPGELAARLNTQLKRKRYAEQLRERLEESLEMAVIDPLTGLYNRRYMGSRLRQAIDAWESSAETVSVILFDIDHFKRINDTWGHQAGDEVLRAFTERMNSQLRALDIAGRHGGEEFMVVLSGASEREAMEAAERVRAAIARTPFRIASAGISVDATTSAGVAEIMHGDTPERLIARADAALYQAKAQGRNQVMVAQKKAA
ncbi:MAG: PleD family two-component system response regulator [Caulobacterales bacterium]|uniref:PleD family two-component system response regulator n=1 Tax=Glycocaulis sp. TaxID=1969725 RepID=UPI003FA0433B